MEWTTPWWFTVENLDVTGLVKMCLIGMSIALVIAVVATKGE